MKTESKLYSFTFLESGNRYLIERTGEKQCTIIGHIDRKNTDGLTAIGYGFDFSNIPSYSPDLREATEEDIELAIINAL